MASRSHRGSRAAAAPKASGERLATGRAGPIARALRAHEHRSAALLLGLVVLVYLWPALVQGHLLSPTALVYTDYPWQAFPHRAIERWINGDLGDVPYAYYPWDVLARRLIRAGTFPAWNPYALGGTQLWANAQIAWLSPFSLPLWLLPLTYGLGLAAALKLWCAGFGSYLLARELRLSFWPAIVAGIGFALGAFNVVWLSYGIFVSVAAMLPWALWLVERILRRGRAADGLGLAAVAAVALLGGHPGTQVHVLAAVGLYALVRAATSREHDRAERARRLLLVGGGLVVGGLVAAVVLVPAQLAAGGTVGAAVRRNGAPGFRGSQMPFGVARTALFPDWWGRPSESIYQGPATYRERTFYAGAATLVLALIALATAGRWRRKAPFALLGALGLAIALRLPGLYDLVIRLPGFDQIQNSRISLWFTFAVAMLAAFGLQRAIDVRGRLGRAWLAPIGALLAGVVAIATIAPGSASWAAALHHVLDRMTRPAAGALALASVVWWLLPVAALTALLWLVRARPRLLGLGTALVVLLVAFDLLHFASGFEPIGPASRVVPPKLPAIAYLQRRAGAGRISGVDVVAADWTTLYGLHDVRGSDAPQPTTRFFGLWRLMDPTASVTGSLEALSDLSPRVLGILGARYVMLPPRARVGLTDLQPVYRGPDATIFENTLAVPRAFVAGTVTVADGANAELATLGEASFDPRRDATVRAGELGGVAPPAGARGSARVVRESNASVTLRATLAGRGLVVLDDTWADGWSVTVDGRPAHAQPVDAVLRGVVVPAGTHAVVWRYRVPGLALGAALSGLGLLAALAWAGALVRLRRRRRAR